MDNNQPDPGESRLKENLASIAEGVFDYLGKTFPVCCWSDEFPYFPQIIPPQGFWTGWDNFTQEKIEEAAARLASAERAIGLISQETEDFDIVIDAETLKRMMRTLREQLVEVRFHETQPTFHLTLMCTALAASLGDSDRRAWSIRAQTLPSFLKKVQEALIDMPRIFRDLGLEMIRDISAWLRSLDMEQNQLAPVYSAIERFADFLRCARTRSDYLLPPYLKAIRAASAYSFTPANPSQKGTFFIVPPEGPWSDNREELAEYRMLTAHETYPGHHLLDTWRWHFISASRRRVESPLFYEGWACFSEELMRITGYFSGPADLLLLAKRRCRRAVRGLVDLDLQTGMLDRRAAAQRLVEAGFSADAAASVVPKYALRPGVQVCYTFGIRRFADLYIRYGTNDAKRFVQEVLSCGEIGFDLLEKCLHGRAGQS